MLEVRRLSQALSAEMARCGELTRAMEGMILELSVFKRRVALDVGEV